VRATRAPSGGYLHLHPARPARTGEPQRPGSEFPRPPRQNTEPANHTFKDQPDQEQHRSRTPAGVTARVQQPIPALTAAIWHNDTTGQSALRSLAAYDH
jgi:hypothetical protein